MSYCSTKIYGHEALLLKHIWPDDAALVLVIPLHVKVTVVSNGKDMRRHLSNLLVGVQADLVSCVDGQKLIWVHCHQYWPCVCLKKSKVEWLRPILRDGWLFWCQTSCLDIATSTNDNLMTKAECLVPGSSHNHCITFFSLISPFLCQILTFFKESDKIGIWIGLIMLHMQCCLPPVSSHLHYFCALIITFCLRFLLINRAVFSRWMWDAGLVEWQAFLGIISFSFHFYNLMCYCIAW